MSRVTIHDSASRGCRALADAQRRMASIACHPSMPAGIVGGEDWWHLQEDVKEAALMCHRVVAIVGPLDDEGDEGEEE